METNVSRGKTTVAMVLAAVLIGGGHSALAAVHESTLTIKAARVAGELSDFVVYVDLADMDDGFWGNLTTGPGTTSIVVKNAGGISLSREIVWLEEDNHKGEMHFKAHSLSGALDTTFTVSVGGTVLTDNRNTDTWSNGYLGVWHLGEENGDHNDSTSVGTEKDGHRHDNTYEAEGKVGSAQRFDGTDDYIEIASLGGYNGSSATVSAWVRLDELPSGGQHATVWGNYEDENNRIYLFCSKDDRKLTAFGKNEENPPWSLPDLKSDAAMSEGAWQYVSVSLDTTAGHARLYLDDAEFGPSAYSSIVANIHEIGMVNGSHFFDGLIDEFRISNEVRSADWILTEYNNQSSPWAFYTVTPEPGTFAVLAAAGALCVLLRRRRAA